MWFFAFPGQGAQAVGMGKGFADASPAAKAVFAEADKILGIPLSRICFEGPKDELTRTDISQPAILTTSIAIIRALEEKLGKPLASLASAAAGLSLGEYTAHVFAGSIAFGDALRLVRARGQYMQEACDAKPSTMASVLGLDRAKLEAVVADARSEGIVVLANLNAPAQIVISGEKPAVARAGELAKAAGAKRVVELTVAGAFHSPLMQPAQDRLAAKIAATPVNAPACPVWANATAAAVADPATIRETLTTQLTSPVLWSDTLQRLATAGTAKLFEPGPGAVSVGLWKRVDGAVQGVSLQTPDELDAAIAALSA
jgi:[acyl-carrier-protein] S-malonyltransferase